MTEKYDHKTSPLKQTSKGENKHQPDYLTVEICLGDRETL